MTCVIVLVFHLFSYFHSKFVSSFTPHPTLPVCRFACLYVHLSLPLSLPLTIISMKVFAVRVAQRKSRLFAISALTISFFVIQNHGNSILFHDTLVRSPEVIHAKFCCNRLTKSKEMITFVQRQNNVHTCPICVPP